MAQTSVIQKLRNHLTIYIQAARAVWQLTKKVLHEDNSAVALAFIVPVGITGVAAFDIHMWVMGAPWWGIIVVTVPFAWAIVVVAKSHPKNWLLLCLAFGEYRFTPKYRAEVKILGIHKTSNDQETRSVCKDGVTWPYDGWYIFGERFAILEINHEGTTYRTCLKLTKKQYDVLQHSGSSTVVVEYQLARGPKGPSKTLLAKAII
jgi:hypothetical protein